MDAIIAAKNICVSAGGKKILTAKDVKIPKGKRTVILGPNGSGKSTLLKTLAGLLKYDAGSVFFDGCALNKIPRRELAKKMAVLPQGNETPPDLTVEELVNYGRFPHRSIFSKAGGEDDKKAVEWALERTNLQGYRKRLVKNLSGGERQRAWIAMSLAQKPAVLLLDEPTTYLDIAHQLDVLFTVSALNREENLTVAMVLHDINHAVQFADEIILVKDGSVIGHGAPQEIISCALLKDVFGVAAEEFHGRGGSAFVPFALVDKVDKSVDKVNKSVDK